MLKVSCIKLKIMATCFQVETKNIIEYNNNNLEENNEDEKETINIKFT